jgi:hypothetical protein
MNHQTALKNDRDVRHSVVPIFKCSSGNGIAPEQVASAVLVLIRSRYFLLTAAHAVVKTIDLRKYVIPSNHGFIKVGPFTNNETLDLAFCSLSSNQIADLAKPFSPLLSDQICLSRQPLRPALLSVFGCPISKSRPTAGPGKQSKLWIYRCAVVADATRHVNESVDAETHILLEFDVKNAFDSSSVKSVTAPYPKGVSGGGIFAFPVDHESSVDWSLPKLIGIFHTFRQPSKIAIGSRIWPMYDALLGSLESARGMLSGISTDVPRDKDHA